LKALRKLQKKKQKQTNKPLLSPFLFSLFGKRLIYKKLDKGNKKGGKRKDEQGAFFHY
jgi:hypothetical protein